MPSLRFLLIGQNSLSNASLNWTGREFCHRHVKHVQSAFRQFIDEWNVSSATDMSNMFDSASNQDADSGNLLIA